MASKNLRINVETRYYLNAPENLKKSYNNLKKVGNVSGGNVIT